MKKITAVIMAAGQGTRLLPLTTTIPKPLIKVINTSSLEENIRNVSEYVNEIVIVVNYLKDKIIAEIGNNYKSVRIKYAVQKKFPGSAGALFSTKKFINNKEILVMNGDDIYESSLMKKAILKKSSVVGKKDINWQLYGVLKANKNNNLEVIIEKPKKFVGDLINIGFYKVDNDIFDCFNKIKRSPRGEYEITDLMTEYAKVYPVKIVAVKSGWRPIGYPWDLLNFAQAELSNIKTIIKGKVEKGAVIKGNLVLGKNSRIKSGAYLEGNFYIGEGCEIGPNCYLKDFGSIGNNTSIGNAVEIVRSIIGNNTNIKHLSYVGDSIIGNSVNFGAGTIISNLRHDKANILVDINSKLIDSGRNKFGAVVGDGVKTAVNTAIYPGSKLDAFSTTSPGEIVKFKN